MFLILPLNSLKSIEDGEKGGERWRERERGRKLNDVFIRTYSKKKRRFIGLVRHVDVFKLCSLLS